MNKKNQSNLNEIIKFRLEKIKYLNDNGINPYPYNYTVVNYTKDIVSNEKEFLDKSVNLAGRIVSLRKMGKTAFINVQDMFGNIQIYIKNDNLKNQLYDSLVRKLDLGDIVGIKGKVFYTKTKELSINCSDISILAKNIYPLPNMKEKDGKTFFSFEDKEHRYRKRYLDLIINSDTKNIFIKRFDIINQLRDFLNNNRYIEVETPILQPLYGGANARPFTTYHNTLDEKLYLRIADELYLKRLIIGGFDRVYEISKNFRNEGMDKNHNPEFTMLEFYCAYADIYDMMNFTEEMLKTLTKSIDYKSKDINFQKDFKVFSFFKVLNKYSNSKISDMDIRQLKSLLKKNNIDFEKNVRLGKLLDKAFTFFVEPKLITPTFIVDYPKELSPLAKEKRDSKNGNVVERFELFINGMEIANAFTELNNPIEQRRRLVEQSKLKELGDKEAQNVDEDFLEAIETGMPPTGGVGIGIDRLVMILTSQKSIKDVILFPAMKNENIKNK